VLYEGDNCPVAEEMTQAFCIAQRMEWSITHFEPSCGLLKVVLHQGQHSRLFQSPGSHMGWDSAALGVAEHKQGVKSAPTRRGSTGR
jgi:hypothetical protein